MMRLGWRTQRNDPGHADSRTRSLTLAGLGVLLVMGGFYLETEVKSLAARSNTDSASL